MIKKKILDYQRIRQVPRSFSWVDHKFLECGYFERSNPIALALYLFLVTVGDSKGLSYYSDANICFLLKFKLVTLEETRNFLIRERLIAYEKPLYQVLAISSELPSSIQAIESKSIEGGKDDIVHGEKPKGVYSGINMLRDFRKSIGGKYDKL